MLINCYVVDCQLPRVSDLVSRLKKLDKIKDEFVIDIPIPIESGTIVYNGSSYLIKLLVFNDSLGKYLYFLTKNSGVSEEFIARFNITNEDSLVEAITFIKNGQKLQAVKTIKEGEKDMGLKEAKDIVDALSELDL